MKGMILAAGEGTRLGPLTHDCPKPMLPIDGRPLLEHTIGWLRGYGVDQIALNLHHQPEAITGHFSDGRSFGVSLRYSFELSLLGTAGAVKQLEDFFDAGFVLVYGDVLTDMDLAAMIDFHRARGGLATLALHQVDNPADCGLVQTGDQGRIVRFLEKPGPGEVFTDLANAGIYVLEPSILALVPGGARYDFGHDLFPHLLQLGLPMYGYPIPKDSYLVDIGSPDSYQQAQQDWPARARPAAAESPYL